MYTYTQRLLLSAPGIRESLRHEPAVRPRFDRANIPNTLVIMFCAMWNGIDGASALYRYLESRGCPLDRSTIDDLLAAYEGEDPLHHLWMRNNFNDYHPLFDAMPDDPNFPDESAGPHPKH